MIGMTSEKNLLFSFFLLKPVSVNNNRIFRKQKTNKILVMKIWI